METRTLAPSNSIPCPKCNFAIRFYAFGGMGNVCPHFYCDCCSNVFHRESDFEVIYGREPSAELLAQVTATLPECPCGGRFTADSSPKCPACTHQIPHQSSPECRLFDPHAIVIENALYCTERNVS